jgi:hypothetical protein
MDPEIKMMLAGVCSAAVFLVGGLVFLPDSIRPAEAQDIFDLRFNGKVEKPAPAFASPVERISQVFPPR